MSTIFFILVALIALSIIVVIHELGHFLVAKKSGVWVEEFGLGLPPRVWGKKIGETLYSINALPIGGFVRLHGESLEEGAHATKPERAFVNKSKGVRIAVALAGIAMNFLLALVCFSIVYSATGIPREVLPITINEIAKDSPADKAGIKGGDRVISVEGRSISSTNQVKRIIAWNSLVLSRGKEIEIVVTRIEDGGEKQVALRMIPRLEPPKGEGAIGIAFSPKDVVLDYPPMPGRLAVAAFHGVKSTAELTQDIILGFAQISQDVSEGQSPQGVLGPSGIVAATAAIGMEYGVLGLVNLMGIISLNLAIFNLIPFPPLDGSRVFFVFLETFISKKRLPKIEAYTQQLGMALLIILAVVITTSEIPRIIKAGSLSKFVETIIPQ